VITFGRRAALQSLLAGGAVATIHVGEAHAQDAPVPGIWARGIDGQRKADLGDGRYLNPVLPGDHPDPTILKDGSDYYMTFSSFDYYPGIIIWHSRDLVNWTPIGPALKTYIGSVYALDIAKHRGRYFIYIPSIQRKPPNYGVKIYAIHAPTMSGPWSEPVDMGINGNIDPGHAVGEDGKRYLFLSDGDRVRISDDGLHRDGEIEKVYDGWRYPPEWVVETYALEGPKVLRRNGWFYLVSAVGGTAGPPTSHLVIAARSRSIHGPWENCPHNPIVRTMSREQKWWSRGHASLVEGPNERDWWMVYHGYENGFRTLGRQMLLDPIEWTEDGWFRTRGGDLSVPLPKPLPNSSGPHGAPRSDDFSRDNMGIGLSFFSPGTDQSGRVRIEDGALIISAAGTSPHDCAPLAFIAGDLAYEVSVEMELGAGAQGGLLLFYNPNLYSGVGFDRQRRFTFKAGLSIDYRPIPRPAGEKLHLRMVNDHHDVTIHYGVDGQIWTQHEMQMETSGLNHNVGDGFLSLRPALYAAGQGEVRFRNLRYQAHA
jgi:xylan 1,4-beta-xylosidase